MSSPTFRTGVFAAENFAEVLGFHSDNRASGSIDVNEPRARRTTDHIENETIAYLLFRACDRSCILEWYDLTNVIFINSPHFLTKYIPTNAPHPLIMSQ